MGKGFPETWTLAVVLSENLPLAPNPFLTWHLNHASSFTTLIPLTSLPQFPHLPHHRQPLSATPCLMLPPAPQTSLVTEVYPHGADPAGQSCCQKVKLYFSPYTFRYEAERLWHISGMPRKLICVSPSLWHRLNPISRFIVSMSCARASLWHTQPCAHT